MQYVDRLLTGEEKTRDIALCLILWLIAGLAILGFWIVAIGLPFPEAVDILAGKQAAEGKALIEPRFPVPAGDFSVQMPVGEKVVCSKDGRLIMSKITFGDGGGAVAVGVDLKPTPFTVKEPWMTEGRKAVFKESYQKEESLFKEPFVARRLNNFRPIKAKGMKGFEAHWGGGGVDKRYVELYLDNRRLKFEVARKDAKLTAEDYQLLYAIVASVEDFASLKKNF